MNREQLLEDEQTEWWKAGPADGYDINKKLLRVGCRPLKRKILACRKQRQRSNYETNCIHLEQELEKCINLLEYVQATSSES